MKKQFIALSAVEQDAVKAFAQILVYLSYMRSESELPRSAEKSLGSLLSRAEPFLTRFKIRKPLFTRIVKGMIDGEYPEEDIADFIKIMRAKKDGIHRETDIDTHFYKLIQDCNSYIARGTESAMNRIAKAVSHFNNPNLSRMFLTEVDDQGDIETQLRKLVKRMTRTDGMEIDADQRKKLKEKKPELLKQYNKLRRELNAVPKNFITSFIRQTGKALVPVHEVIAALKKAGIKHHSIPSGYRGFIDDHLVYYTEAKLKLNGTPAGDVLMNPNYDAKKDDSYVCQAKAPMAKDYSRIYTVKFKAANTKKKFNVVGDLSNKVSSIRSKWLADLRKGTGDRRAILAMCCELVYLTSARIGSTNGNTAGEKTYGLTSLTVGHYKKRGDARLLEYKGKKAQIQKHLIPSKPLSSKLCVEYLDEMVIGKKRVDRLITFNGRPIAAKAINEYLKTLGVPAGVTIHKFRTLRGTVLARKAIDRSPFKNRKTQPTQKQVNDWLKKNLEKVAKELGHFNNGKLTVNTAIQNYIDPSLLEEFYEAAGVRPLAVIERSIKLAKGNV